MNPRDKVTIDRRGHIYFGYRAARNLGITGWKWLKITPYGEHTLMRICMTSVISEAGSHVVKLNKVRGSNVPMAGSCLKFTDELAARFGEFESLSLRYTICPGDVHGEGDSVLISVDNPPNKFVPANSDIRTIPEQEEEIEAREAYFAEFEKSLGTISKPTEPPALGKPAAAPRTRPLPKGLPEWLHGPLSRGEQVRVVAFKAKGNSSNEGWVSGAFIDTVFGEDRPVAIIRLDCRTEPSFILVEAIKPCLSCLKPAAKCLAVAKDLGIGLSPMQIEAIINGGVPPENHGLPDEMFE